MNNFTIKGLSHDSRAVKPGDVFFAFPGLTTDGRKYIEGAIQKGAIAIIKEGKTNHHIASDDKKSLIPQIPYDNLQQALGYMASRFYDEPSKKCPVIGITGTNGKTSCSHFIASLLNSLGVKCAVMGTLGVGFLDNFGNLTGKAAKRYNVPDDLYTTRDAIQTQEQLKALLDEGSKTFSMEVTSHALSQSRVNGITFHTTIFTNLTRDHLDYHNTMEEYWAIKKQLFTEFNAEYSIINVDDSYGLELYLYLLHQKNDNTIIGYSRQSRTVLKKILEQTSLQKASQRATPKASQKASQQGAQEGSEESTSVKQIPFEKYPLITTENLALNESGIKAIIHSPFGQGEFQSHLLGHFNVNNILASIAAVCVQGFPLKDVLQGIQKLQTVAGRMNRLGGGEDPIVVVDYAHTPDALKQVLKALRSHTEGRIISVFGCGGDRDQGKRPLMAEVAEALSDKIIVTTDNPRNEDPAHIINDIIKGFKKSKEINIEMDRKKAIHYAIQSSQPRDIILIAGKGHEEYQIIKDEKIPFDDKKIVEEALQLRRGGY